MQFGLWLPVYGGWLRARGFDVEPSAAESCTLAENAERLGFTALYGSENFLNCIHGPAHDIDDAWTLLAAIAARTRTIRLIGALKPGFRPALVAAQMVATLDRISGGRVEVNIVTGWWSEEFARAGVAWQPHDEKYTIASSYLEEMEAIWAVSSDAEAPRRRLARAERPPIWVGGHSESAFAFASRHADVVFLNGMDPKGIKGMCARLASVSSHDVPPSIAMSAFVILENSRAEAQQRRAALLAASRPDLIARYRRAMAEAGAASWAGLSDEEMIDTNGGFATALVGTGPEIAERLIEFRDAGVDIVMCQFPDMLADAERFARSVVVRLTPAPKSKHKKE